MLLSLQVQNVDRDLAVSLTAYRCSRFTGLSNTYVYTSLMSLDLSTQYLAAKVDAKACWGSKDHTSYHCTIA